MIAVTVFDLSVSGKRFAWNAATWGIWFDISGQVVVFCVNENREFRRYDSRGAAFSLMDYWN